MKSLMPQFQTWPHIEADMSNMDEVLEFSKNHQGSVRFLKAFHSTMGALCDPHVVFARPEAPAEIEDHLHFGDPTALAMTHLSLFDPSNAGAAIHQEKATRGIEGRTVTQARADFFNIPVLNVIFTYGRAWPVWRDEEMVRHFIKAGLSEEEAKKIAAGAREQKQEGNDTLLRTGLEGAGKDGILTTYPEGKRNRGDPTQVRRVLNALKKWRTIISEPEAAKIILMAYDYGGARILKKRYLSPTICADIMDAPAPEDMSEEVRERLQVCTDIAIANRPEGLRLSPLGKAGALAAVLGGTAIARQLARV